MAETIKSGITRIEEGPLLPESVRFESEPWTSFYMAGETIRKLRKASEKKASTEAEAPEQPEDNRLDEEASSRMGDEGCINERAATVPDATGYSGTFGVGCGVREHQ
jgi:hypothetical protein